MAVAYYYRGIANFFYKKYEKAWGDVYQAQVLGYKVPPGFLKIFRNAKGTIVDLDLFAIELP